MLEGAGLLRRYADCTSVDVIMKNGSITFLLLVLCVRCSLGLGCGILSPGQSLVRGQAIQSCDGQYRLLLQLDGNLVEYGRGNAVIWSPGYKGSADLAVMQWDGNFVVYRQGRPLWATGSFGYSGAYLQLQTDGNLVVYLAHPYTPLWSWMTTGYPLMNRAAAQLTAAQNTYCTSLGDFFWQIGDASGPVGAGAVGSSVGAGTVMPVASASKLLFSTYVIEKLGGRLSPRIIKGLNFTSGFGMRRSDAPECRPGQTVRECFDLYSRYDLYRDGVFSYGPGHMLEISVRFLGLGPLRIDSLSDEVGSYLGNPALFFGLPSPAAGIVTTPAQYGALLQDIVAGKLLMHSFLGTNQVCTNPDVCPFGAAYTPIPRGESWNYSLGHWVESDPIKGDGAFSSPGLFGFYPWIDSTKTFWGVLARVDRKDPWAFFKSAQCGRLIRKAWMTAHVQ